MVMGRHVVCSSDRLVERQADSPRMQAIMSTQRRCLSIAMDGWPAGDRNEGHGLVLSR